MSEVQMTLSEKLASRDWYYIEYRGDEVFHVGSFDPQDAAKLITELAAAVGVLERTGEILAAGNASKREKLTAFMIRNGFATGHGDTLDDLLTELEWQLAELRARLALNPRGDGGE